MCFPPRATPRARVRSRPRPRNPRLQPPEPRAFAVWNPTRPRSERGKATLQRRTPAPARHRSHSRRRCRQASRTKFPTPARSSIRSRELARRPAHQPLVPPIGRLPRPLTRGHPRSTRNPYLLRSMPRLSQPRSNPSPLSPAPRKPPFPQQFSRKALQHSSLICLAPFRSPPPTRS
jgi:hypothetical protein